LSTSPTLPTPAQLATTRLKQWHQNGEALLTFENLRSWINAAGLALYNPRAQQLPTPAPSMVEAVLGASNAAPTPSDAEQARSLLARLIAEGAAVPLNLLGNPTGVGTDTPDFIAATAILPYIFTLRGDKSWKQPPTTSGATKVSPLALATYELLSARAKEPIPGLSASALATELGKEVTTAAVLRSLTELWQHLRVLPIPQQDGAPTLWELTSARFTKQLKAGANAGQPTALSALISLYLGQSIVATEAEIETFLSPLAARTRVRDVVHALLAARRLETIAIEGRTVLHVTGDLPAFLCEPTPNTHIVDGIEVAVPIDDIDHLVVTTEGPVSAASLADSESPEPRIKKFIPKPRKIGTGFVTKTRPELAKPARKPFGDKSERSFGTKPAERTRRPFTREGSAERPTFNKPWEEEKIARLSAASAPSSVPESDEGSAPTESGEATFRKPSFSKSKFGGKPAFGAKRSFGDKPSFGAKRSFGDKPAFGAKRDFSSDRGESRPPRRDFGDKPAFDRKRSFGDKPSFGTKRSFSSDRSDSRPPRRNAEGTEAAAPRYRKFDAPRTPRPFNPDRPARPARSEFSGSYAGKREGGYAAKSEGYKGKTSGGYKGKSTSSYAGKSEGYKGKSAGGYKGRSTAEGSTERKPYSKSPRSEGSYAGKSEGGYAGKSEGYKGKSASGYKGKSSTSYAGKSDGYKGKTSGGYKGKSTGPSARSGKPASTFDKFKDNKKPFGKRPPARKWKPEEAKSE
jgi:23S rRNA pseudouridine2605 synthase